MNVLIFNYILVNVFAFVFLYLFKSVKGKKMFIIATTLQLIIINGLRDETVGIDTLRYERRFREIQESQVQLDLTGEPLYDIAQKIIVFYTRNFNFWLFVVSIIIFGLLGFFIYRYSSNYYLSYIVFITLGYLDFSFSGIRQMLAMILVLFTYKYIYEKKLFKFVLLIFVASLIHLSAVIALPMYFVANIKWNRMNILITIISYVILYLLRFDIGWVFLNLYYRGNPEMIYNYFNSNTIGGTAMFILGLVVIGMIVMNPFKYNNRKNTILINLMVISFFIQSLSSVSYLFTRLNMYYLIFMIIYIPKIANDFDKLPDKLKTIDKRYYYLLFNLFIVLVLTAYYINSSRIESNLLPYAFFWE